MAAMAMGLAVRVQHAHRAPAPLSTPTSLLCPTPFEARTPFSFVSSPQVQLSKHETIGLVTVLVLVVAGILAGLFLRSIGKKLFPSLRLVRKEAVIPTQHDGEAGGPSASGGQNEEPGSSVFPVGGPGFGSPPGRPTLLVEHMTYTKIRDLIHANLNNHKSTETSIRAIKELELHPYEKALMPKIMLGLIYEGVDWFDLAIILLVLTADADYSYKIDEPLEHLQTLRMRSANIANNMGRFYGTIYDDKLEKTVLRFFQVSANAVATQPFLVSFLHGFFRDVESIDFAYQNGCLSQFFCAATDQDKVVCRDFIKGLAGNYQVKGILKSLFRSVCGEDPDG